MLKKFFFFFGSICRSDYFTIPYVCKYGMWRSSLETKVDNERIPFTNYLAATKLVHASHINCFCKQKLWVHLSRNSTAEITVFNLSHAAICKKKIEVGNLVELFNSLSEERAPRTQVLWLLKCNLKTTLKEVETFFIQNKNH